MMAIRQIRYADDKMLKMKCKTVSKVDDRIRKILNDMMDTLHATEHGAALAANQVGILKRLVVVSYGEYQLKLVNPRIIGQSGVQDCVEGCLSFPNRFGRTIRPQMVTIEALNEYGHVILLTGSEEMAKCFCHEIEHLDGETFLDKVIEFMNYTP